MPSPVNARRILIVDDDIEAPRLLKRLLENKRGYDVRLEHHAVDVSDAVREFRPELVLMDVIMPDTDGCDLARQLHSLPGMERLPIVFISAISEPVPGYPFLSKPVPVSTIIETIEANLPKAENHA